MIDSIHCQFWLKRLDQQELLEWCYLLMVFEERVMIGEFKWVLMEKIQFLLVLEEKVSNLIGENFLQHPYS